MGYNNIGWDSNWLILGVLFMATSILVIVLLDKVQGRISNLQNYLISELWKCKSFDQPSQSPRGRIYWSKSKILKTNWVLQVVFWIFLCLPLILLISWVIMLMLKDEKDKATGIAVFLGAIWILTLLFGVFKIKWDDFQPSSITIISLSLSLLFLTAFQLTLLLLKHSSTFFGLSSVFMTTNAILTITIVFMSTSKAGASVVKFLKKIEELEEEEQKQNGIQQEEEKEEVRNKEEEKDGEDG